jgi:hypothetical protein
METPFVAHGHVSICNSAAMLVMILHREGKVRFKFVTDKEDNEEFESDIFYDIDPESTEETRPYFQHGENKYYLDEVGRIF